MYVSGSFLGAFEAGVDLGRRASVVLGNLSISVTQVQHVVPEVTIPPEVTPENVTTYIVDSGSEYRPSLCSRLFPSVFHAPNPFYALRSRGAPHLPSVCILTAFASNTSGGDNDRQHLESEIRKAHVICVVYSIDNPNSFDRIPTYWLPYFRQLGVNASPPQPVQIALLDMSCTGARNPCWQQD